MNVENMSFYNDGTYPLVEIPRQNRPSVGLMAYPPVRRALFRAQNDQLVEDFYPPVELPTQASPPLGLMPYPPVRHAQFRPPNGHLMEDFYPPVELPHQASPPLGLMPYPPVRHAQFRPPNGHLMDDRYQPSLPLAGARLRKPAVLAAEPETDYHQILTQWFIGQPIFAGDCAQFQRPFQTSTLTDSAQLNQRILSTSVTHGAAAQLHPNLQRSPLSSRCDEGQFLRERSRPESDSILTASKSRLLPSHDMQDDTMSSTEIDVGGSTDILYQRCSVGGSHESQNKEIFSPESAGVDNRTANSHITKEQEKFVQQFDADHQNQEPHLSTTEDRNSLQPPTSSKSEHTADKRLNIEQILGESFVAEEAAFGEIVSADEVIQEISETASKEAKKEEIDPFAHEVDIEDVKKRLTYREDVNSKHLELKDVLRYKRFGEYPAGVKDKTNFRKQTKRYTFDGKYLLYSIFTNGREVKLRAIVEPVDRLKLLRYAHDGPVTSKEAGAMSAHKGRDAVIKAISLKYYWPGLSRDIREYLRTCEICQRVNDEAFKVVPELRPVGAPREVMKQVGVDLMDLGLSVDGTRYCCVLICYHSKWSEAKDLQDKTATAVALFLHEVMCRHGCFSIQINDQGREFVNQVSEHLHRLSGTKQRITSAYHPQANGLVERQNRTIQLFFKRTLQEKKEFWSQCLQSVIFAHRTMVHNSTKFSPFFVLYGRHPVLPMDLVVGEAEDEEACDDPRPPSVLPPPQPDAPSQTEFDEQLFNERLSSILKMREHVDEKVEENRKAAQRRQKRDYDRRNHTPENAWSVGDTVMIKNMKNEGRKGGKMDMKRSEGYEIVAIDVNKNCTLKNRRTKLLLKTKQPSQNLVPLKVLQEKDVESPKGWCVENLQAAGDRLVMKLKATRTTGKAVVTNVESNKDSANGQPFKDDSDPLQPSSPSAAVAGSSLKLEENGRCNTGIKDQIFDLTCIPLSETDAEKPYLSAPKRVTEKDLQAIMALPEETLILSYRKLTVRVRDLTVLLTDGWFTDNIINFYLKMIEEANEGVFSANTFLYQRLEKKARKKKLQRKEKDSVLRWFPGVDLFAKSLIFIPINLPKHWILCTVKPKERGICFYDSLNKDNTHCAKAILWYLEEKWKLENPNKEFEPTTWTTRQCYEIQPQVNGVDCGSYVAYFCRQLAKGRTCCDNPKAVSRLRRQMVFEILSCTLHEDDFLLEPYSQRLIHKPPTSLCHLPLHELPLRTRGVGLQNVANNCYLNSCLQLLFHCPVFATWLMTENHEKSRLCVAGHCITCHLLDLMKQCHSRSRPTNPAPLLNIVGTFWQDFTYGDQQDAQEFLSRLLTVLDAQVLERHDKKNVLDIHSKETGPASTIFGGYWRTDVTCDECNEISSTFSHFTYLPIDAKFSSVDEGLNALFTCEHADLSCSSCAKNVTVTKRIRLEKCPCVLLILVRYSEEDGKVEYADLNINEFIDLQASLHDHSLQNKAPTYKLKGMVNHSGIHHKEGHYQAIVEIENEFYEFNDSVVHQSSLQAVRQMQATAMATLRQRPEILMYIRKD